MTTKVKDQNGKIVEIDDDERDVAFFGFATATPQQLLRLRGKHAGATTNLSMRDEDKEDTGEYDHDMAITFAAKRSLWGDLCSVVVGLFTSKSNKPEYDDLGSDWFNTRLRDASRRLCFQWTDVQQRLDASAQNARETRNADNFMNFQHVRLERKVIATEIAMAHAARHGDTEDYNRAKAAHDEFVGYDGKMTSVIERMQTLHESEKNDLMAQAFQQEWTNYTNKGELPIDRVPGKGDLNLAGNIAPNTPVSLPVTAPAPVNTGFSIPGITTTYNACGNPSGNNVAEIRQAASNDGKEQPFIQTLKNLFTAATRFFTGDSSKPATACQAAPLQPQPVVTI